MGGGQTSLLYKSLVVEDKRAVSAWAYYHGTALDESRFIANLTPAPGVGLEALDKAFDRVLAKFLKEGVDKAALERAKTRLVADAIYARDSQSDLARWYGSSLAIGQTIREVEDWPSKIDAVDAEAVLAAARRWLAANAIQPGARVFVFAHLFDLHKPYIRAGYDAELAYTDRILGAFKQALMRSGWWPRSLVVLLSDHGESLGEHGEDSHGYFIYESTLRVPLIVHWPDGAPDRPARDDRPGSLMDVAPTVLDFLHIAAPPSFEGRSLLDAGSPRGVYSESLYAYDGFGWAPLRSLREGAYKYIDAPGPELYNLAADPREQINLYGKYPARARTLKIELGKLLASHAPKQPASPANISPRTRALLASLGYLSRGARAAAGGAMPDPKERLPEYRLYERAQALLYGRRLEEAAATFRQILARDPKNTLARRDLGGTYVEQHLYGKARECFEAVVASAPDDYMAQFELGIADKRLGLAREALEHLQAACKVAPGAEQCRRELEALRK